MLGVNTTLRQTMPSSPAHKLRLIHTSDTHLGDPTGHPRAGEVLSSVVDSVKRLGGDALLLAGDVFDNERVSDDVVEWFVEQMALVDAPVIVLPGNHDLAHETSVYRRAPFLEAPDNLCVICNPSGETLAFPDLSLELWGRAMLSHTPGFRPLDGMPMPSEGNWLVAMAHGHFHFENDRDQRSSPIYAEDVAASGCHYLALGHWDRHADVSRANTTAVYSGCPYGPIGAPEQGAVCVVDLDPESGVSYRLELLAQ